MITYNDLFTKMGPGAVVRTAYDTAWVARLAEISPQMSNLSLSWLCEHQLPDGSWGASEPFYYHDRVISTLAAMIALTYRGKRARDKQQLEAGLHALEVITTDTTRKLISDPNGATAGFEMIVPTLVAEAERLGIIKQQGDRILGKLARERQAKLAVLRGKKVNKYMTLAFSAEMAGSDAQGMLDIENLQEADGSISHSPSATAYFLLQVQPDNEKALNYLKQASGSDGAVPFALPFELCEQSWVLWNVGLSEHISPEVMALCKPHLDHLWNSWRPTRGIGFTAGHSVMDGDDTSLAFDVLTRFGYNPDVETLLSYEEEDHFRCYPMEITLSVSTNVHFLSALRRAGVEKQHPRIQKILQYLQSMRNPDDYWFDKWNASPYYTTAHAIIALTGVDNVLAKASVDWMVRTQRHHGGWGFYNATAEETAYALQALAYWKKYGGYIPDSILKNGLAWLEDHSEPPYSWFWIAKTLNYSEWIVRAEILSAQTMVREVFGGS